VLFTHQVTAIKPLKDRELILPLWAQLNSPAFRERAEGFATGTTVAGLPMEALTDFEVWLPDSVLIKEAGQLLSRVWSAEAEDKRLVSLRDMLLPEMLSGRLRVKDAESIVENV
jgi:type I restriction enzyme S subunit